MREATSSLTEQLKYDAEYTQEITQKAEEQSDRVHALEDSILVMHKEHKDAKRTIDNQQIKIEKLQKQNDMFRKFYARNMADNRPEQLEEVDEVF